MSPQQNEGESQEKNKTFSPRKKGYWIGKRQREFPGQ